MEATDGLLGAVEADIRHSCSGDSQGKGPCHLHPHPTEELFPGKDQRGAKSQEHGSGLMSPPGKGHLPHIPQTVFLCRAL